MEFLESLNDWWAKASIMSTVNIISEIKKCVTFIFIKNEKGTLVANGTGFFVGVKNETNPEVFNVYLVSAKHVLQDKKGNFYPEIGIRLNKKDGSSQLIVAPLNKGLGVHVHADQDVDLALFPCLPDDKVYDFKFIQDDLVATQQTINKFEICEGDDVFFAGLFTSYIGQQKNQPITRFGKVALMPDEKIEWKEDGKAPQLLDLYLFEFQSFGGNSGAPAFFHLIPTRKPNQIIFGPSIFFGGVVKGGFLTGNKLKLVAETEKNIFSLENIGITAIIPSYRLHEILFSEELKVDRTKTAIMANPNEVS